MPQEFHVLKCFSCSTFQVHIVKKSSNKWQCKMCNEKQSLKQVFGRGTGQECRIHVQKLNTLRLSTNDEPPQPLVECRPPEDNFDHHQQAAPKQTGESPAAPGSKWSAFLPPPEQDSSDDEDPVQMALKAGTMRAKTSRGRKRAANKGGGPPTKSKLAKATGVPEFEEDAFQSFPAVQDKSHVVKTEATAFRKPPPANLAAGASSKWGQFLSSESGDQEEEEEEKLSYAPPKIIVKPESKWSKFVPTTPDAQPSPVESESKTRDYVLDASIDDDELDALLDM